MLKGHASGTALMVTALRALESTRSPPLFEDEQAYRFLPAAFAQTLRVARRSRLATWVLRTLPEVVSPGRQQHIALRTRVIDDLVFAELERGIEQFVLIGAGFDTRAYRLPLGAVAVFEVDHPATQRRKRALGNALEPRCKALHFVAADLEHDDVRASLVQAGFDPGRPCLVLWEGVTMYLTLGAVRRTIEALAALAAPQSRLLVTYHDASGDSGRVSLRTAALASLVGERFRCALSPRAARALAVEFGLVVEADTGRDDWARVHGRAAHGRAHERLLVLCRMPP